MTVTPLWRRVQRITGVPLRHPQLNSLSPAMQSRYCTLTTASICSCQLISLSIGLKWLMTQIGNRVLQGKSSNQNKERGNWNWHAVKMDVPTLTSCKGARHEMIDSNSVSCIILCACIIFPARGFGNGHLGEDYIWQLLKHCHPLIFGIWALRPLQCLLSVMAGKSCRAWLSLPPYSQNVGWQGRSIQIQWNVIPAK